MTTGPHALRCTPRRTGRDISPDGPAVVRLLIEAGADPDAPVAGSWHSQAPLHWAASSDDVDVADALIDGGADMEAQGASIGGGTPLDDAVAHGNPRPSTGP
jgi:uncharacterized protein